MYKVKEVAKRGSALMAAVSLLAGIGASALPSVVSADALNPLTQRSLELSSSSPGWSYVDGSGNSLYAPPNSGANGQKTGNTFTFRMSSVSKTIKAMTFQYCTTPAGTCIAPGNDSGTDPTRGSDTSSTSDLNWVTSGSQTEMTAAQYSTVNSSLTKTPNRNGSQGNFVVLHADSTAGAGAASYNGGGADNDWSWSNAANLETPSKVTGKNNLVTITASTGQTLSSTAGDYFKIVFYGTDANYLTNPGSGAFFVRINTYDTNTNVDAGQPDDGHALDPTQSSHIVDGGVTVANVMNESISIQTKVLETMAFSVGTYDPDKYNNSRLQGALGLGNHGQCSALLMADPNGSGVTNNATYLAQPHNVLHLGNPATEYALDTGVTYDVASYWRLSSNSSGGATVYYTGHTLTNTENDQIAPMNDTTPGGTSSTTGTEQFGLAIDHGSQNLPIGPGGASTESYPVDESGSNPYGTVGTSGDFADFVDKGPTGSAGNPVDSYAHLPRLYPLVPATNYANGNGTITNGGTAKFAFNGNADTYAQPIASENTQVVNCVTAKMRYIANIAATTPAGIYTTKVNYVAAPQY